MNSIVGCDYGNFYFQAMVIQNIDPKTLRGGVPLNLCDPTSPDPNGTPSAFFYSSNRNNGKPVCGYAATRMRPISNIVRYLKRNMRGSVTLDGRTFTYAEMITQTIQHCVREANRQLRAQTQTVSNEIGLAYPASFEARERKYLISLAEKATLEDGTPIKVVGTITEPAAAALDYLAEHPGAKPETCVMAYDLGAGTFDLSVVEAFPNGKKYADGSPYYYDVRWTDGLPELGGLEFDKKIRDILIKKIGYTPKGQQADLLMQVAEQTKRELTVQDIVYPPFGEEEVEISIEEFNAAAEPLVMQTIDLVKAALNATNVPKPDLILLTGGASRMRIVRELLEQEIPQYRGKIVSHRPSQAIACGAARFATVEQDNEIRVGGRQRPSGSVQQRTTLDLGIQFWDERASEYYIDTMIKQGTPIPCTSSVMVCRTLKPGQRYMEMGIFEARKSNPNNRKTEEDYENVMPNDYDFRRSVKAGTEVYAQMMIDKDNVLSLKVWEPSNPAKTEKIWPCTYEQWRNK